MAKCEICGLVNKSNPAALYKCRECIKFIAAFAETVTVEPYADVQKVFESEASADRFENSTQYAVKRARLGKVPLGTARPEKQGNWKWKGLNANGSLPDSWWAQYD